MNYYHVLLTFQSAPDERRCVLKDLDEKGLKKQFLEPYARGTRMLAGSEVIDTMTIHSTTIVRTAHTSDEELRALDEASRKRVEEMNRDISTFVFFGPPRGAELEDIVDAGSDVTKSFITAPPGSRNASLLGSIINHPLIFTVVTGLIVAGIAKALGWV